MEKNASFLSFFGFAFNRSIFNPSKHLMMILLLVGFTDSVQLWATCENGCTFGPWNTIVDDRNIYFSPLSGCVCSTFGGSIGYDFYRESVRYCTVCGHEDAHKEEVGSHDTLYWSASGVCETTSGSTVYVTFTPLDEGYVLVSITINYHYYYMYGGALSDPTEKGSVPIIVEMICLLLARWHSWPHAAQAESPVSGRDLSRQLG